MSGEFYSTLAQTGRWRFIPLEVSKGRLPDGDVHHENTKGNHAIMLYLVRHAAAEFELDAIVACISDECTLIAHIRRNPCGLDIAEALDAETWNRAVTEH